MDASFYDFFVGLDDIDEENVWKWSTTKREFDNYYAWDKNQPDGKNNEDCAQVKMKLSKYSATTTKAKFRLSDVDCNKNLTIICEMI